MENYRSSQSYMDWTRMEKIIGELSLQGFETGALVPVGRCHAEKEL